ncbi:NAD(+) synthase [Maribacter polysiphoniae]|uniref:Glutamine-dependent NAD(+) synthetase n=1 Tax=Maribacter polysiphoniae TaxID=429344 RepID=A0A316E681_9FLAO|nr:NAD(+) synthase [Maribacter polysiphoniae]MBD1259299.1 NAD(+) synthase [Maribacter polysiphoniae]PWK24859.1 NAD+ synthase (glutamine-hydrolysing) [Maribacter polysiphoniae]
MTDTLTIALGQMDVVPGRPRLNVDNMLRMIQEAKEQSVDLICFPEMCVGGYLLGDKFLEDAYCEELMSYNEELLAASNDIAIAYGNIYVNGSTEGHHPNKDGRSRKYNAVYVMQNGTYAERVQENGILPTGVQPKTLLPNYRFFDDERYFFSLYDVAIDYGKDLSALLSPFLISKGDQRIPIGMELCEDLWCHDYRADGEPINITKILIAAGAESIVNLSASPWTFMKNNARDRRVKYLREQSGSFVKYYYVNCVGVQNNGKNVITFDGGSTVYNEEGDPCILSKKGWEEDLMVIDEKASFLPTKRPRGNTIREKYLAIFNGLKNSSNMLGDDPHFVIGLSGGIDSSLVATLLVLAFGKEKVVGVNMPSQYNSDKTKGAAKALAENLGIEYLVLPIEDMVKSNTHILQLDGKPLSEFNLENVQAKIRGASILSNLSAKYRYFFTNNGNKVEIALGYATLYGDWGGAITPIGDLTKTEVADMCHYINDEVFGKEIIPELLLPDALWRFGEAQIQPTAELKSNQVDPMKFGYHCKLLEEITNFRKKSIEDIMTWYVEGNLHEKLGIGLDMMLRWHIDDPKEFLRDLEWFYDTIQKNVFKRVQSPPIILTSKSSYGYDIRESILPVLKTKKFKALKERIMAMDTYMAK